MKGECPVKPIWKRSLSALAAVLVLGASGLAASAQIPEAAVSPVYSAVWNDATQISPEGEYTQAKQAIYEGLLQHQEQINVAGMGLTSSNALDVYVSVLKNHPELFAPKASISWSYNPSTGAVLSIIPQYYYTAEEVPAMQAKIDAVVEQMQSLTQGMSDYDTLLTIHDWLAERMTYDYDVASSSDLTSGRTAYDALVRHQGVCEAYDFGFRLLANELGFETGYAKTQDHIWSMVKLDGEWYHVDVTHDDPSIGDGSGSSYLVPGCVLHTYFLVSDAGVQDANHGSGSYEATNTATSTRFDGENALSSTWDGVAVWNGGVYLADDGTLYTGDVSGSLTSVDTGLLYVSSAAAYPDGTSGLLLTGYHSPAESEGLYRFSQDGLEKLADLSAGEYFNDPQVIVWCSYAAENPDGAIAVTVSSTLQPEFQTTVVTLPASEPEPEPCRHPNLVWEIAAAPTAESNGILQGVCPDCQQEVTKVLLYGDLNLDGGMDVLDVMTLAQTVVGSAQLPKELSGDYNGDSRVDVLDVMTLVQMALPN